MYFLLFERAILKMYFFEEVIFKRCFLKKHWKKIEKKRKEYLKASLTKIDKNFEKKNKTRTISKKKLKIKK